MNRLDGLSPKFRARVEAALAEMSRDPLLRQYKIIVVEGLRDLSRQMAYFARGRMKTEHVVAMYLAAGLWKLNDTEAQTRVTETLKSKHLDGLAVDIAPSLDGKIIWNAPREVWGRMGAIGKSFGLAWGGDWKSYDCPHFEQGEA